MIYVVVRLSGRATGKPNGREVRFLTGGVNEAHRPTGVESPTDGSSDTLSIRTKPGSGLADYIER